jgi:hypothetical protein
MAQRHATISVEMPLRLSVRRLEVPFSVLSREALVDHRGTDNLGIAGRTEAFERNRAKIERLVIRK